MIMDTLGTAWVAEGAGATPSELKEAMKRDRWYLSKSMNTKVQGILGKFLGMPDSPTRLALTGQPITVDDLQRMSEL
jgi:hypothetical protein